MGENPFRRWIADSGKSHRKIAAEVGVTGSAVHYWTVGSNIPSPALWTPLAKALGVTLDQVRDAAVALHQANLQRRQAPRSRT